MKLSHWARQQGIPYKTAHRWFQQGVLPVRAIQLATGTILVQSEPAAREGTATIYARVSGRDQKSDLERQIGRLSAWAADNGIVIAGVVGEIASGLNGARPKLQKLLRDPTVATIIVEQRERLARFGVSDIEAALQAQGRRLVVVDTAEMKDDLVQDMIDVLTAFSARLYGRRSARHRAQRALAALQSGSEDGTSPVGESAPP
jgi:putative resolvase